MKSFAVFTGAENGSAAADVEFVRDGFSFFAFVSSALWCIWHGLWRELALIVIAGLAIVALGLVFGNGAMLGLGLLLALYVGFEAGPIREQALARRGFAHRADIAARNRGEAELIWFTRAGSAA
jgi:hypothetical protein